MLLLPQVGLDWVTDTDQECEKLILGGLRDRFSAAGHQFIGEETSDANVQLTDAPTWMGTCVSLEF